MKKLTLLLTGVFALTLCSFAVQEKRGVKKIGENLYEVNFKMSAKDAQSDQVYQFIEKHYDLSDLKSGKVERIDLTMERGAAGPQWAIDDRITPMFVEKKMINYDNVTKMDNSSEITKVKALLDKYSK